MKHPRIVEIVRRAVDAARLAGPALGEAEGTVPVSHYLDPARLAAERARLFRGLPFPIAHVSELEEGNAIVREIDGVSLLLVREGGAVRAFLNACRHRSARILREDAGAKAFVCPYHGWTYARDGALLHVPHAEAFPSCKREGLGLVSVRAEERHGLVWVALDGAAPDVRTHLGAIDEELASLELERHVVLGRARTEQRGNWKMLMEAFLDGYHIRTLHRDSVYPFFVDARSVCERAGIHVRAASARRAAREAASEALPLRDLATVTYTVFPATTIVLHPDWTGIVTVQPLAPDRFLWSHLQLAAEAPATDAAKEHFARSFALIEGRVFQGEDLHIIAETQAGLATGANTHLTFGLLESPAVWFHASIGSVLGQ